MEMIESLQWDNWADKLSENAHTYVTPNDPLVQEEVSDLSFCKECPERKNVMLIWNKVQSMVEYRDSPEWKTPRMTLRDGVGDCEDFAFLLASMFPHAGVGESKIHAGNLIKQDGTKLAHSWNEVGGLTVDATATPESVRNLTYNSIVEFTVRNNE